ncbi:MAG: hypothetical protein Ct9H300mP4_13970 [Gammaproteobacteria bacterium]|nr:MAG: hypothetical protein Ct9H300mP4_13970 [Gammaproteobacteria bacterium]
MSILGSGSAYRQAPAVGIDFDNLRGEGVFDSRNPYGDPSWPMPYFPLNWPHGWKAPKVTSNVIHPGLVKTNIARLPLYFCVNV